MRRCQKWTPLQRMYADVMPEVMLVLHQRQRFEDYLGSISLEGTMEGVMGVASFLVNYF
jgi:hypothetical protein